MSALQILPASGPATDEAAALRTQAQGPERRIQAEDKAQDEPAAAPDPGVQATFSPQSLQVLANAALGIAGSAKDLVQQIGQSGVETVAAAADALDAVGSEAADAITSGAASLVKGVDAARSGVKSLATAAGDAVSEVTQRAGAATESAVGYAALAALAGGALLNELA